MLVLKASEIRLELTLRASASSFVAVIPILLNPKQVILSTTKVYRIDLFILLY